MAITTKGRSEELEKAKEKIIKFNPMGKTAQKEAALKKFPERKREKELGLKAKERLKVLCGKKVLIEVVDKGKYGRPLINIFTGETERDICKILIEEKLAIKYQGEKKTFVW